MYFPFPPYEPQLEYMRQVIRALEKSENALLESPTGTGKTLSLLCGTLAWLRQNRSKFAPGMQPISTQFSRIIYTSRTHSQLSQV